MVDPIELALKQRIQIHFAGIVIVFTLFSFAEFAAGTIVEQSKLFSDRNKGMELDLFNFVVAFLIILCFIFLFVLCDYCSFGSRLFLEYPK